MLDIPGGVGVPAQGQPTSRTRMHPLGKRLGHSIIVSPCQLSHPEQFTYSLSVIKEGSQIHFICDKA